MRHAKSYAREKAFKSLYEYEVKSQLHNGDCDLKEIKDPLAKSIVDQVIDSKQEIDTSIKKHLKKWSIRQLNPVNLAILEVAIWEMMYDTTDNKIIISEALNLANIFSDVKSKNFIHFVLDQVGNNAS